MTLPLIQLTLNQRQPQTLLSIGVMFQAKIIFLLGASLLFEVASAELAYKDDKAWLYPTVRVSPYVPENYSSPCDSRYFSVLHRRNEEGGVFDVTVTPLGDAEHELIPTIISAFERWKFSVPAPSPVRDAYLRSMHTNLIWTSARPECPEIDREKQRRERERHNKSLQQTFDPAAISAIAELSSASIAAEHRRYVSVSFGGWSSD